MTGGLRRERIDNHLFVSLPATEFQAEAIERLGQVLSEELAGDGTEVRADSLLDLGRSELQPDFALLGPDAGAEAVPQLVAEVQRESTDRYALGIKRLAYGRAGIGEYWFADPVHGRLVVMRLEEGDPDYHWPPFELHHGERIPEGGFGAGLEVDRVLPPLVERYQLTERGDR